MFSRVLPELEQLRAVLEAEGIPANATCDAKVADGASMVKGLTRYAHCKGKPVFKAEDGKTYCAAHGVAYGYVPPPKKAKQSYVIFYTLPSGQKSYAYAYDKASERGAVQSFKRDNPGATVDGVAVYTGDAALKGPEFNQWRAWMA